MSKLIENRLDAAVMAMSQAVAKVKDEGERAALRGALGAIENVSRQLPSCLAGARYEAEISTAKVAARELCHWAQNEDPRTVERVLDAIRGGHVSDLSLIF